MRNITTSTRWYNEKTRLPLAGPTITNPHQYPPDDPFYKVWKEHALPSREAALACGFTGFVYWMEDGALYTGYMVMPGGAHPVGEKAEVDPGINWCTIYAQTKESLFAAVEEMVHTVSADVEDYFQYDEDSDLWNVQVHYSDGRVR